MRIEAIGDPAVAAVDREQELEQVVRADRQEVDARQQLVELVEQGGDFHHRADVDALGQAVSVLAQIRQLALDHGLRLIELVDDADHREHDLQRSAARGAQQRADLAAQQPRPVEAEPDRTPAERGIFLGDRVHVGQGLVAADVEGAKRHRLVAGGVQHRAIERELLARARQRLARP